MLDRRDRLQPALERRNYCNRGADMTDFLLELRSEEIPARMQDDARADLKRLFEAELTKAGLKADDIATYATPRRLALIAYGLPLETEAVSEETKGPKIGAPPQALEGFLRKTGLTQDQLVERDGVYFAIVEKAGQATADVLAEAIPAIIRAFPWPKSQRWGAASVSTESLRWVRPLQGIVALLGDDVVACEVDGILSGAATMGHRFHHAGEITIGNVADYAMKLRAAHVILDQEERRDIIRAGADKAASYAGLKLVPDAGLVGENAGLTEWPVPMLGRFDPAFLEVPEEVIQLTARVNQKYFICRDKDGKLANAFVCTANISAHDGGAAIVAGNEKVLAARLSDAKFFWEQDLKVLLEDQAKKLSSIVFHEKLGTVADKVERLAKLAQWLVTERIVAPAQAGAHDVSQSRSTGEIGSSLRWSDEEVEALAVQAERAARLCKADLVTGMVGEFPELQGIMGGYYARAQGEDDAVADAIRDHYKPVGQGDNVPTAPVTVAVSLADKLDTIISFIGIKQTPTGSKDPFALRRAALGTCSILQVNGLRLPIRKLIKDYTSWIISEWDFGNKRTVSAVRRDQHDDRLWHPRSIESFDEVLNCAPDELILASRMGRRSDGLDGLVTAFVIPDPRITIEAVPDFLADRLKVQQREAGVRHDLIDAVFALGGEDDLVRLLARVKALQAFVTTDEGVNLLAGYKRAANILKQAEASEKTAVAPAQAGAHRALQSGTTDEIGSSLHWSAADLGSEERALLHALNTAEPLAASAIEAEDFEGAMAALATLRAPIDAFFEGVMVNDPDPAKRAFRLGLLARFRDAVHKVADFSRIEG
jgi:glycyl-tRNA synthetase beta chain